MRFFGSFFEKIKTCTPTLTKLYIPALLIIILLSIVSQMIVQYELKSQLHDSYVINLAGRQRMLSQNIVKQVLLLVQQGGEGDSESKAALVSTVEHWVDVHERLKQRKHSEALEGDNSEVVDSLFTQVDPYVYEIQFNALAMVAEFDGDGDQENIRSYLSELINHEGVFFSFMDEIVDQYDLEARARVSSTERLVFALFVIIVLTVLFEGLLIFRPASIQINKFIKRLNRAKQKLQASYEQIEEAQEQLVKANQTLEDKIRERTQELKEKNDLLRRTNADLDNFVYVASHDLRAPIGNIDGLVKVLELRASEDNPGDSELFEMIHQSIAKLRLTLSDLSDTGRIRNEVQGLSEFVSFSEVLDDVKVNIKDLIIENKAIIKENFEQVPEIKFSRKNLRSILYNLISNAIKYHSPQRPPVVEVISRKEGEATVLQVSDNGMGMKQKDVDQVFAMYSRLQESEHIEGTGVGMAMVKKIVENAGGKIHVQSEEGKGSVFSIFFK
ncbi:ATP-binding protein [Cytophagaceae bacterium ABcell3]|nr:ATP-binding protein [Cytophagaceae bacterium ABcell3]